jgi:hypothetical protein
MSASMAKSLKVAHVFEHDARKFEDLLNQLLRKIETDGGTIDEIKYASDAATSVERRGGFGALVVYEIEA